MYIMRGHPRSFWTELARCALSALVICYAGAQTVSQISQVDIASNYCGYCTPDAVRIAEKLRDLGKLSL